MSVFDGDVGDKLPNRRFGNMIGSNMIDASSQSTENSALHLVRKNVRKALDWLLVPASAGVIANVAAIGLSHVIGGSGGIVLVVAAVLGAAVAKYIGESSAAQNLEDPK